MKSTSSGVVTACAYPSIHAGTYSVPHRLPHEHHPRVAMVLVVSRYHPSETLQSENASEK